MRKKNMRINELCAFTLETFIHERQKHVMSLSRIARINLSRTKSFGNIIKTDIIRSVSHRRLESLKVVEYLFLNSCMCSRQWSSTRIIYRGCTSYTICCGAINLALGDCSWCGCGTDRAWCRDRSSFITLQDVHREETYVHRKPDTIRDISLT